MAFDFVKVGTDLVVGGALGAGGRVAEWEDEKKEDDEHKSGKLAAAKKLPVLSRIGTYVAVGAPIAAVIGVAAGLTGDWATRVTTGAGVLAGEKLAYNMTTKPRAIPAATWTVWERQKAEEAARGGSPRNAGVSTLDF